MVHMKYQALLPLKKQEMSVSSAYKMPTLPALPLYAETKKHNRRTNIQTDNMKAVYPNL